MMKKDFKRIRELQNLMGVFDGIDQIRATKNPGAILAAVSTLAFDLAIEYHVPIYETVEAICLDFVKSADRLSEE